MVEERAPNSGRQDSHGHSGLWLKYEEPDGRDELKHEHSSETNNVNGQCPYFRWKLIQGDRFYKLDNIDSIQHGPFLCVLYMLQQIIQSVVS